MLPIQASLAQRAEKMRNDDLFRSHNMNIWQIDSADTGSSRNDFLGSSHPYGLGVN